MNFPSPNHDNDSTRSSLPCLAFKDLKPTKSVGNLKQRFYIKKKNAKNQPTTQTKLNYQTRCPPAPNLSCTKVQGYRGRPKPFPNMKGWVLNFFTLSTCQLSNSHVQVSWPFFVSPIWLLAIWLLAPFCHDHPILVSADPAFCGQSHRIFPLKKYYEWDPRIGNKSVDFVWEVFLGSQKKWKVYSI